MSWVLAFLVGFATAAVLVWVRRNPVPPTIDHRPAALAVSAAPIAPSTPDRSAAAPAAVTATTLAPDTALIPRAIQAIAAALGARNRRPWPRLTQWYDAIVNDPRHWCAIRCAAGAPASSRKCWPEILIECAINRHIARCDRCDRCRI